MTPLDTNPSSDEHLLRAFTVAGAGSEAAFAALVRKYLGLVLGIAGRRTGDRALAEEIAQNVFMVLARKAKRLSPGAPLAGWLHRVTVIECAGAMRSASSQKAKMNAVSEHLLTDAAGRDVWREALPVLDEGIDALARGDREVIVLRFFERKSFREIGAALGKSDDAAQKQTERALEKLSGFLRKKGLAVSAGALATGLGAVAVPAASAALAQTIAHGALSAASTFSAKLLILKTIKAMTYTKSQAAIAVGVLLSIPLAMQWSENHRLHEALDQFRSQSETPASGNTMAFTPVQNPASTPAAASTDSPFTSAASIAPDNVAQDWELALYNPDPVQRSQRISELLAHLSAEAAPAVIQAFNRADGAGLKFDDERRLFLRAWGRLDGAASMGYVVQHWGQAGSPELLASLAGWSSTDPRRAREWTDAAPAEARASLIYGLLDGWSLVDFPAAAAYAQTQPGTAARDHFCELLSQRALRAGGVPAAQEWVYRIPDNEANLGYKQRAFDEVIQAMLLRDPAAAAQWIAQLHDQPFVAREAVGHAAAKLAEASPLEALQWLSSIGNAGGQSVAQNAGDTLKSWAEKDVVAAGTWLGQNVDHPFYDAMAGGYVQSIIGTNPQAATAWADTIHDDALRQQALASKQAISFLSVAMLDTVKTTQLVLNATGNAGEVLEVGAQLLYEDKGGGEWKAARTPGGARNPHGSGTQWQNCTSCHH